METSSNINSATDGTIGGCSFWEVWVGILMKTEAIITFPPLVDQDSGSNVENQFQIP